MSTNLDLVNKFLSGITQSNPLSEDQDSQSIGLANDLYSKYSQTQSQAPDRPSIDQNDLIQKLKQETTLAPTIQDTSPIRYTLDDLRNDPQFMTVSERFFKVY